MSKFRQWTIHWCSSKDAPRMFDDDPEVWPIVICEASGSGKGSTVAEIHWDENNDPQGTHSPESFDNALALAAAPAFAQAWQLVSGEIKRQIFDRLNTPESKWVEESINAFERGDKC